MSELDRTLRVADADRERVAERLRLAGGEGRVAPEELEERLEAAFAARTRAAAGPGFPSPLRGTLPSCRRNASSRLSTTR